MNEPRYWNCLFAQRVVRDYEGGGLERNEASALSWCREHDADDSEAQDVMDILCYYDEGHRLPLAMSITLERIDQIKAETEGRRTV